MFKAKVEIGGYAPGSIVPDEKGKVWEKMYDVSPVEYIPDPVDPILQKSPELDLNHDGKFDAKDKAIASKVSKTKVK